MPRDYLPKANAIYHLWRHWQKVWTWTNVLIGGVSTALGALVAANTKTPFLGNYWAIAAAILAPVLTFLLTTLRPQAKAAAFETASRELEKARNDYEADPTKDDIFLADGVNRGIDLLNKVG